MKILPLLLLLACLYPPAAWALDLRALIREVEEQHTGLSSEATMSMQVKTRHWERNLEMEAISLERDHFLVRILAPPKEKGVASLKVGQEVWNYLPKVDRVIKVPPSMMGGAWMGSHLTNNDLVKAAHVDEDYDFRLLEETDRSWRIDCIPKSDAAVVWGRIIYQVDKATKTPTEVDYYDEEGEKVRTIVFDDVQSIGSRTVPMRMTVQPHDKPNERTVFHYSRLKFDMPLEKSFFSLRNLRGI